MPLAGVYCPQLNIHGGFLRFLCLMDAPLPCSHQLSSHLVHVGKCKQLVQMRNGLSHSPVARLYMTPLTLELQQGSSSMSLIPDRPQLRALGTRARTPLSAILGCAQLVESGSPPPTLYQKRSIDQIPNAGW